MKHTGSSTYQVMWLGRIAGVLLLPDDAFVPERNSPARRGYAMPGIVLTLIAVLVTLSFAFYAGYEERRHHAGKRGEAVVAHRSRPSKEGKAH